MIKQNTLLKKSHVKLVIIYRKGLPDKAVSCLRCEHCEEHKLLEHIVKPGWPWYLHEECAIELGLVW